MPPASMPGDFRCAACCAIAFCRLRSCCGSRSSVRVPRRRRTSTTHCPGSSPITSPTPTRRLPRLPRAAVRWRSPWSRRLQDGRLLFSAQEKRVFMRDRAGAVLDAATGKPAASVPADLSPVRVNNRVRRAIDAAMGGLTLMSPDPAKRLEAARAVFKSKDPNALEALDRGDRRRRPTRTSGARWSKRTPPSSCSSPTPAKPKRSKRSASCASAATRRRWRCCRACRPARRMASSAPRRTRSARSRPILRCGTTCRTSGTDFRSARFCCSPRSASPSPSASWA